MYEAIGIIVVFLAASAVALLALGAVWMFVDHWLGLFRLNWFDKRSGGDGRINPWSLRGIRVAWRIMWRGTRFKGADKRGYWVWSIPGAYSKPIRKLERWEF